MCVKKCFCGRDTCLYCSGDIVIGKSEFIPYEEIFVPNLTYIPVVTWCDISTAPQDGSFFLAADELGDMYVVNYPPNYNLGRRYKTDNGEYVGETISGFTPVVWTTLPELPK